MPYDESACLSVVADCATIAALGISYMFLPFGGRERHVRQSKVESRRPALYFKQHPVSLSAFLLSGHHPLSGHLRSLPEAGESD